MADCSFCGKTIVQGCGVMFVQADGKILWFCGTKCEKNMNKLGRVPRDTRWTKDAAAEKQRLKK